MHVTLKDFAFRLIIRLLEVSFHLRRILSWSVCVLRIWCICWNVTTRNQKCSFDKQNLIKNHVGCYILLVIWGGGCRGCGAVLRLRIRLAIAKYVYRTVCIVRPYQPFRIQGYIIHKHLTELPSRRLFAGPGPLFYSLGQMIVTSC